jgi:hypothetical protein
VKRENEMKRYNLSVTWTETKHTQPFRLLRGIKKSKTIHVYANSEDEAINLAKQMGYQVNV